MNNNTESPSPSHASSVEHGGQLEDALEVSEEADMNELPEEVQLKLHLRKGEPLTRCRAIKHWPTPTWNYKKTSESFDLLLARIKFHVDNLKATGSKGLEWPDKTPYVQPTNSTTQKSFRPIFEEDFESALARAWNSEKKRLGDDKEVFINIFVYLKDTVSAGSKKNTIHRATEGKIQQVNRHINSATTRKEIQLVDKAMLPRDIARRPNLPEEGDPIEVPDHRAEELRRKRQVDADEQQKDWAMA
ncbi:hypothetical protein BGZ58_003963 [Dissophora ornata]|nr:hypothetical protein BGZ58_003963 [Dissophora ornata]